MNYKKISLAVILPLLSLSLAACSITTTQSTREATSAGPDLGGVFLSTDGGVNFKAESSIPTVSGQPGTIANFDIKTLALDPSDNTAIYAGTYNDGLFYSYNILTGWTESKEFPKVTITNIAVNPQNKCDIYATFTNHLYRSVDCARTWKQVYLNSDPTVEFTSLAIDFYNPLNLYMGDTAGNIMKSIDGGISWRVLKDLEKPVGQIVLSPKDSRQVFVATKDAHLFSFQSNTNTNPQTSADIDANFAVDNWTDLNKVLEDLQVGSNFRRLVITANDGMIFLATDSAIAKSPDNGVTWQKLNLLPTDKDGIINTIAVNPQDSNQIYYATDLTFSRSTDGGASWSNKKLPTRRGVSSIIIDYQNPTNIYLGMRSTDAAKND